MSLIGFDDGGNLDDKSARSVFVGNIPYEVTEERLKEIFSAVGQVLSFKLVYDRENGKPRGYGFCEYPDPHLARTAINNLNGYEVAGRALRVDSASTEKSRLEMQNLMSSASSAGQAYGNSVEPDKAPESISKAVASLPPEQMFELMKQMKVCIEHDPQDARHMLLQNPQLAYALLQALVVMRIVDPEIALAMLHNPPAKVVNFSAAMRQANPVAAAATAAATSTMPNLAGPSGYGNDPPLNSFDPHRVAGSSVVGNAGHSRAEDQSRFGRDPRSRDPRADRGGGGSRMMDYRNDNPGRTSASAIIPSQLATTDPDHAQLIMQVLQLTDEQISMLPLDQQASILDLKRQLNSMPK